MRRTLAIVATSVLVASTVALAAPANAANSVAGGGASFPYVFLSQCAADFNASQSNFTLAKIFSGVITTWNHPEIIKDNPRISAALPATPITIAYRSDSSGTTNNFLQYLNAWAPTIFPKVQDDMTTAFPGGKPPANSVAGKGNSGVMANVLAKEGTIGYVDLGDAKGYPSARIQNAKGEFIAPSSASAAKNLANQTNIDALGLVQLNYKVDVSGAYPMSIFSYALVRTDGKGPNGLGVRQFQDYVIQKCGPSRAASLGYVPVAGKVLAKAKELVAKIK